MAKKGILEDGYSLIDYEKIKKKLISKVLNT